MVIAAGAFTPTCSVTHLPGYIQSLPKLKEKGVDIVAVLAFNDAYVMSAWGKANNVRDDSIVRNKPTHIVYIACADGVFSSSFPTPTPSSLRVLAGRTRRRAGRVGMRL